MRLTCFFAELASSSRFSTAFNVGTRFLRASIRVSRSRRRFPSGFADLRKHLERTTHSTLPRSFGVGCPDVIDIKCFFTLEHCSISRYSERTQQSTQEALQHVGQTTPTVARSYLQNLASEVLPWSLAKRIGSGMV